MAMSPPEGYCEHHRAGRAVCVNDIPARDNPGMVGQAWWDRHPETSSPSLSDRRRSVTYVNSQPNHQPGRRPRNHVLASYMPLASPWSSRSHRREPHFNQSNLGSLSACWIATENPGQGGMDIEIRDAAPKPRDENIPYQGHFTSPAHRSVIQGSHSPSAPGAVVAGCARRYS